MENIDSDRDALNFNVILISLIYVHGTKYKDLKLHVISNFICTYVHQDVILTFVCHLLYYFKLINISTSRNNPKITCIFK